MDLDAQKRTQAHYDRHAPADLDSRQAMGERQSGPSYPLKQFHNEVKRLMMFRFAHNTSHLLDLACGRGGDLHKWVGAGVRHVKGIDLSHNEILEAQRRYEELVANKPNVGAKLRAEFEPSDSLGNQDWVDGPGSLYDAVTCMFAIHYFFVTAAALKQFLRNVSLNLKIGGYFFGTCPDGKKIIECLMEGDQASGRFRSRLLHLRKLWTTREPQCFGSSFKCAIMDTVTEGIDEEGGSEEYLVFENVLKQVAAQAGLEPVRVYDDSQLDACFLPSDKLKPCKHFNPKFFWSHHSLELASALNMAFAFKKVHDPDDAAAYSKRQGEAQVAEGAKAHKASAPAVPAPIAIARKGPTDPDGSPALKKRKTTSEDPNAINIITAPPGSEVA